MRNQGIFFLSIAIIAALANGRANADTLPPPIIPQCVGVNIHFTGAPARDLDGLASAGFGWIRMDFVWEAVEKARGRYDFTAYDQLLEGLTARHIKPLFILDYGNKLYQDGSPRSPEAQAAFARFAAAVATHYKGKPVLWEIWNEPNGGFWKPNADAEEYGRLALVTAQAIKQADPRATVLAPGTAGIPLGFLEHVFQMGLLKYIDAVSLHPYRGPLDTPETAASEYRAVRLLIHRYAPKGRQIALVASEWGYSSVNVTEERQAQYLTREWLSNLAEGIRLSIWYDWHDDGTDPKEGEHHFGTVRYDYTPKPAFLAAQSLIQALRGFSFVKRLPLASDNDYVLLFADGPVVKLAAWTTGDDHAVVLHSGLRLTLTGSPQYLPLGKDAALQTAASWTASPKDWFTSSVEPTKILLSWHSRDGKPHRVRFGVQATTPAGLLSSVTKQEQRVTQNWQTAWHPFTAAFGRVPLRLKFTITVDGVKQPYAQESALSPSDPLILTATPLADDRFQVQIDNPAGTEFAGRLSVISGGHRRNLPVRLPRGMTHLTQDVPGRPQAASAWSLSDMHGLVVAGLPARRFAAFPDILPSLKLVVDGDLKLPTTVVASLAAGPSPGTAALRASYQFAPGWSFWRAAPSPVFPVPGRLAGMGLWVNGDGSGNMIRARFRDATGQTFQAESSDMTWSGWRFVSFRLIPSPEERLSLSHWGGADDGQVHFPVQIDTLFLLDSLAGAHRSQGAVSLAQPYGIYEGEANSLAPPAKR